MHIHQKNQKLQFLIFQLVKYCNRYWALINNPSHCNIMSKNSSEAVPDCFLSRPSLNISYCQSGPQPTLMTGEAAQGGHTDTHTNTSTTTTSGKPCKHTQRLNYCAVNQKRCIIFIQIIPTGGSNKKKKGWHAKEKQYNKDVKGTIMQFSLGIMHFVIISK